MDRIIRKEVNLSPHSPPLPRHGVSAEEVTFLGVTHLRKRQDS